jgi:glycosyltransferase involved in cell wall biosynthesis
LFSAEPEDYLFYPSRLSQLKRQTLVIEALAHTKERVRVKFAGAPEYPPYAAELIRTAENLRVADRVEWLGQISNAAKADYYARAIATVFCPVDEDYGYVTLEAMLSSKPVITCEDSGGPKEFVVKNVTGSIAEPTPQALAHAMDELWANRTLSATMGRAARERYADMKISWDTVTRRLTA